TAPRVPPRRSPALQRRGGAAPGALLVKFGPIFLTFCIVAQESRGTRLANGRSDGPHASPPDDVRARTLWPGLPGGQPPHPFPGRTGRPLLQAPPRHLA